MDASGNQVAAYTYGPYGKVLTAEGPLAETNPLRYRGYYYDSETGFYYLQSRYYDPQTGRFINADSYAGTGQGILGYNMFSYSMNSPVILQDSAGRSATLAGGIVGGFFGFIGALSSEMSNEDSEIRWDKVWDCTISAAGAGAAAGFIADVSIATCGAGAAIFISAAGGSVLSGVNSFYTQQTLTGTVDYGKVMSDALIGGVTNGLCTGTSSSLVPVAKGVKNGIKYATTQLTTELTPGLLNVGTFIVNDLVPTIITGFGGWYGGLAYDYATK